MPPRPHDEDNEGGGVAASAGHPCGLTSHDAPLKRTANKAAVVSCPSCHSPNCRKRLRPQRNSMPVQPLRLARKPSKRAQTWESGSSAWSSTTALDQWAGGFPPPPLSPGGARGCTSTGCADTAAERAAIDAACCRSSVDWDGPVTPTSPTEYPFSFAAPSTPIPECDDAQAYSTFEPECRQVYGGYGRPPASMSCTDLGRGDWRPLLSPSVVHMIRRKQAEAKAKGSTLSLHTLALALPPTPRDGSEASSPPCSGPSSSLSSPRASRPPSVVPTPFVSRRPSDAAPSPLTASPPTYPYNIRQSAWSSSTLSSIDSPSDDEPSRSKWKLWSRPEQPSTAPRPDSGSSTNTSAIPQFSRAAVVAYDASAAPGTRSSSRVYLADFAASSRTNIAQAASTSRSALARVFRRKPKDTRSATK